MLAQRYCLHHDRMRIFFYIRYIHIGLFLVWCLALLGFPRDLYAQDASVKEVVLTNSNENLLLYFTVANAFTPEMEDAVRNGIPATFTFFVELHRYRKIWLDQEIVSITFDHSLSYDNLKEEYRIKFFEKKGKEIATKSLEEAKALMAEVNGITVTSLDLLSPDEEYLLKVKARLAEKTLPLYFHYLIPFWRLWDFETDWYDVEFRY